MTGLSKIFFLPEAKLIDWKTCDRLAKKTYVFHGVILKVPMGPHSIGTKFHYAVISVARGYIVLRHIMGTEYRYELNLTVGNTIHQESHLFDEV